MNKKIKLNNKTTNITQTRRNMTNSIQETTARTINDGGPVAEGTLASLKTTQKL